MADADIENTKITPDQVNEVAEGKCVTIRELANNLNYSTAWISELVKKGRIAAIKPLGGCWRIPASEAKRIKEVGLSPLPKKVEPEKSNEITVNGDHISRVKGSQKKKETSKRSGLFEMFFGSDEE